MGPPQTAQTSSAQKANGICYIILQGPRAETDGGSRPASLVFPCEANPDLFRHLSEFVWRYQLRLHKISSRLWLKLHDSSCGSDIQIFRGNIIIIVCAQNNGFSGCFDTTLCFPNSLVFTSANEFRTQSAQNPSEKHLACVKSPGFLRACDLL